VGTDGRRSLPLSSTWCPPPQYRPQWFNLGKVANLPGRPLNAREVEVCSDFVTRDCKLLCVNAG